MTLDRRGQLTVPGFVNFNWNQAFTVTVFFQRTSRGLLQSLFGNGYSALSSWEIRMPPGNGLADHVGFYLSQQVKCPVRNQHDRKALTPFCFHTPSELCTGAAFYTAMCGMSSLLMLLPPPLTVEYHGVESTTGQLYR
jgi:hypothetical protein